jgi:hypothetical protein
MVNRYRRAGARRCATYPLGAILLLAACGSEDSTSPSRDPIDAVDGRNDGIAGPAAEDDAVDSEADRTSVDASGVLDVPDEASAESPDTPGASVDSPIAGQLDGQLIDGLSLDASDDPDGGAVVGCSPDSRSGGRQCRRMHMSTGGICATNFETYPLPSFAYCDCEGVFHTGRCLSGEGDACSDSNPCGANFYCASSVRRCVLQGSCITDEDCLAGPPDIDGGVPRCDHQSGILSESNLCTNWAYPIALPPL